MRHESRLGRPNTQSRLPMVARQFDYASVPDGMQVYEERVVIQGILYVGHSLDGQAAARRAAESLAREFGSYWPPASTTPGTWTVERVWDEFWAPRTGAVDPATEQRYTQNWRLHIKPHLGNYEIGDVTYAIAQGFVNDLTSTRNNKPLSHATRTMIRNMCSSMWQIAIEEGIVTRNVWSRVVVPGRASKRERYLSPAIAERLTDVVRGSTLELPVFLAMHLGLRIGEICGLKWDAVTDDAIHVMRQRKLLPTDIGGVDENAPCKRGSERTIGVPPEITRYIRETGANDSEYVCVNQDFMPWDRLYLTREWMTMRQACAKLDPPLNLSGWAFHDLRHHAATSLLAAGVDPMVRQAIMGHKTLGQTWGYTANRLEDHRQLNYWGKVIKIAQPALSMKESGDNG